MHASASGKRIPSASFQEWIDAAALFSMSSSARGKCDGYIMLVRLRAVAILFVAGNAVGCILLYEHDSVCVCVCIPVAK